MKTQTIQASSPNVIPRQWRVLVVDDNRVNQLVARHQLQRFGLQATCVDDGQQAVDALRHERYDLVFMDCQMPQLDGYDATAAIRRLPHAGASTWIIAMTAHAAAGSRARCLAAGMDDYLAKPVSTQALREAMQRFEGSVPRGRHAAGLAGSTNEVRRHRDDFSSDARPRC